MIRTICLAAVTTSIAIGTACNSDRGITGLCGSTEPGFDIEEASVLQDAQGYTGMHDAVQLTFEGAADLPEGAVWRVRSVEIMPMIDPIFGFGADGSWVTVEVWDADNPLQVEPYRVRKQFFEADHEWTEVQLSSPSTAFPGTHLQTWWRFGFEEVIPASGMDSSNYLVGVNWDTGTPPLGYSNFNNPCSRNWTDYDDGLGWVLNEDQDAGGSCSWPMLRVNLETIERVSDCQGERYEVE